MSTKMKKEQKKELMKKPLIHALGAAFLVSAALPGVSSAASDPFVANDLPNKYELVGKMGKSEGSCGEGNCGEGEGKSEGSCGEGKCGDDKKAKGGEGSCGEGKCGGDKKEKHSEGSCGEGRCGN